MRGVSSRCSQKGHCSADIGDDVRRILQDVRSIRHGASGASAVSRGAANGKDAVTVTGKQPSGHRNMTALLRKLVKVPKTDVDRAEKAAKKKKK